MGAQILAMAAPACGSPQGWGFFRARRLAVKYRLNDKEHFHDAQLK